MSSMRRLRRHLLVASVRGPVSRVNRVRVRFRVRIRVSVSA